MAVFILRIVDELIKKIAKLLLQNSGSQKRLAARKKWFRLAGSRINYFHYFFQIESQTEINELPMTKRPSLSSVCSIFEENAFQIT